MGDTNKIRSNALEEAAQAAENAMLEYNLSECAGLADWAAFEAGQESGLKHAAAAIRALSSQPVADHVADAGKVEGDGWSMSPPKFHRYPYFVENISGKWCLCKHHGNGASHTISVHETAREARDAAPASEGAE